MAAQPTAQSSGLLTAGNSALLGGANRNIINGVSVLPGSTVTIYDNATAASGPIATEVVNASTSSLDHLFNIGVRIRYGMWVVVTGGSGAIVYYGGN